MRLGFDGELLVAPEAGLTLIDAILARGELHGYRLAIPHAPTCAAAWVAALDPEGGVGTQAW